RDAAAALGKKACSFVAIDELSPGSHEKDETWLLKAGRSYLWLRTLRVALNGGGETWSNPDGLETWSNDRGHHAAHQNARKCDRRGKDCRGSRRVAHAEGHDDSSHKGDDRHCRRDFTLQQIESSESDRPIENDAPHDHQSNDRVGAPAVQ